MTPATITTEAGHTWCRCPSCRQKLGEITESGRLVVATGKVRIVSGLSNDQELVCWRCYTTVTVRAQEATAA